MNLLCFFDQLTEQKKKQRKKQKKEPKNSNAPHIARPLCAVFFKQTSTRLQVFHVGRDDGWVLIITIARPNLHNAKVFLGRNRNPSHRTIEPVVCTDAVSNQHICQFLPNLWNQFVRDSVRKTTTIAIHRVLPHRRDAILHDEEHAIAQQLRLQHFSDTNGLLQRLKPMNQPITGQRRPVRVMRQMRPQIPNMLQASRCCCCCNWRGYCWYNGCDSRHYVLL